MKVVLISILIVLPALGMADYLQVYRNTSIKSGPYSESEKIFLVCAGEWLVLLDSGKQNRGYYHVQYPNSNIKGYIYRTMVKRIGGEIPRFTENANGVEITVIDVGPGMSAFIKLPNGKTVIYDAGYASYTYYYVAENLPLGSEIEYLILSHTDADHWGSVKKLVENYQVKNVIRTTFRASDYSQTYQKADLAIKSATYSLNDIQLKTNPYDFGETIFEEEGVTMTFLAGFADPPSYWDSYSLSDSKENNGVSIVVRLEFQGSSMIFGGDAVGRNDGKEGCIGTEKTMLDSLDSSLLDTDVLLAGHHGADNASCKDFIEAVSPVYVIFASGHKHRHPRLTTAERFLEYGVLTRNIFRTDRGDFESGGTLPYQQEWHWGSNPNEKDIKRDDDIRIQITEQGLVNVGYVNE